MVRHTMNNLNPINYKIHLEPDLNRFKFSGTTEILLKALQPVHEITLNAKELTFWACAVLIDHEFVECSISVDPQKEEIKVFLPK